MNKEEQMICSHLLDLAEACDRRGYPMGSDFLTLNEQNLFLAFSKDKLPPVSMEMCWWLIVTCKNVKSYDLQASRSWGGN